MTSPGSNDVVSVARKTVASPSRARVTLMERAASLPASPTCCSFTARILRADGSVTSSSLRRSRTSRNSVMICFLKDDFSLMNFEIEVASIHLQARDLRCQLPKLVFIVRFGDLELQLCVGKAEALFDQLAILFGLLLMIRAAV